MQSDIIIAPALFATFGWMVYTISTNIRKGQTARAVSDLHAKLLDKCAGNQDLISYLESAAGRKFLESAGMESAQPAFRILNAIQAGFVLAMIGTAELIVRSTNPNPDTDQFLLVTGAIALAIGIGFLMSAVTSFTLSKSWGLLKPSEHLK